MTRRSRLPTINDVAERAGVSKSLVSLVMRGSPNVSDARRAAVLEAADELGYRPNAVARSLVRQRTGVIGVVLSDLHNPFFADVADGIEEEATGTGYRALLTSGFLDSGRETVAVETLLELRVDGLILLGNVGDIDRLGRAARHLPLVLMNRESTPPDVDSVRDDDRAGIEMLVAHLTQLGHRDITLVSAGDAAGGPARLGGYRDAMTRRGLDDSIRVVEGSFTHEAGRRAMREILDTGPIPTAILAPNDFAALGILEVADERGVRVPDDVSVTGYDNLEIARMQRLDITTIEQPAEDLGRTAVALLVERIEEGRTEPRQAVLMPKLIVGSTTGPPRTG